MLVRNPQSALALANPVLSSAVVVPVTLYGSLACLIVTLGWLVETALNVNFAQSVVTVTMPAPYLIVMEREPVTAFDFLAFAVPATGLDIDFEVTL